MQKYLKDRKVFHNNLDIHVQFMNFKFEPAHTHDFFEFVYMLRGSMVNKIDGVSYETKEGSVLFIDCDQIHEIYSDGQDIAYINILASKNFLNAGADNIDKLVDLFSFVALQEDKKYTANLSPIIEFKGDEKEEIENLIQSMLREYNNPNKYTDKILHHYFFIFIIKLLNKLGVTDENKTVVDISKKMESILEYIEQNYNKHINLEEIAEKFFYNSSYFSRLFKKMCGRTFNGYVQDLRIKKAILLMSDTDYSIEKISGEVGYADKKQFYKIFKKRMGMTPSRYKREVIRPEDFNM